MATNKIKHILAPDSTTNRPGVFDSDLNRVITNDEFTVNENTRVNIGSSPNSNDGEPLRTAFIKINDFIEASYRVNDEVAGQVDAITAAGNFLGAKAYSELTLDSNNNDTAVLKSRITASNQSNFESSYPNIEITTVDIDNGQYVISGGSILRFNNSKWEVVQNNNAENISIDFDDALAKLASGQAVSTMTSAEQITLYEKWLKVNEGSTESLRLKSSSVDSALVELALKLSTGGRDAGYYD